MVFEGSVAPLSSTFCEDGKPNPSRYGKKTMKIERKQIIPDTYDISCRECGRWFGSLTPYAHTCPQCTLRILREREAIEDVIELALNPRLDLIRTPGDAYDDGK